MRIAFAVLAVALSGCKTIESDLSALDFLIPDEFTLYGSVTTSEETGGIYPVRDVLGYGTRSSGESSSVGGAFTWQLFPRSYPEDHTDDRLARRLEISLSSLGQKLDGVRGSIERATQAKRKKDDDGEGSGEFFGPPNPPEGSEGLPQWLYWLVTGVILPAIAWWQRNRIPVLRNIGQGETPPPPAGDA